MIGRSIGSYTIVDKLGSGGMGEVYLAEHRRIARRAAIKFLLPTLSRDATWSRASSTRRARRR